MKKSKSDWMLKEINRSLEIIADEIGITRAEQIRDTALRLVKLKIPRIAVSVCLEHIIELARSESGGGNVFGEDEWPGIIGAESEAD